MSTGTDRRRIAVIGGDGIGPEVCAEALKVVAAAGVELETTDFDLGAARYLRDGSVLPDEVLEELRGYDAILLGAVGPPVGDTSVPSGHPGAGPAAPAALRARSLREPPSLHRCSGFDRRGSRLRRHPGEHRGHLRRRGRVPAQGHARRGGHPGLGQHPHGGRTVRALRLRAGRPAAAPPPDAGAQDQRAHLRRRPVEPHGHRAVAPSSPTSHGTTTTSTPPASTWWSSRAATTSS